MYYMSPELLVVQYRLSTCIIVFEMRCYVRLYMYVCSTTVVAPCLNHGTASFRPRLHFLLTAVGLGFDHIFSVTCIYVLCHLAACYRSNVRSSGLSVKPCLL